MAAEPLRIYLTDHLAGATAGTNLARKIAEENTGTQLGDVMSALAADIETDRTTLENLVAKLGFGRSTLKEAAGWVAERFTRLKFSEPLAGSRHLKLLLELETLSLGIEGKLAMWRALQTRTEPLPADFDLDDLIKRAEEQRATVERHRLEAASLAFTP
ncbi:MAG TPA: hypothetical protein VFV67_14550 [Actinophytocola sp.]|uniref:hypothetical protein n=1 Tax=Actinophytocola sp. TaxID=1872138 RepID=UPI002DBED6CE|nr:hypothetical protein [Actinophytocola sp.]HEU5471868.1 hypothetical protein [Actinophytocola sp.]